MSTRQQEGVQPAEGEVATNITPSELSARRKARQCRRNSSHSTSTNSSGIAAAFSIAIRAQVCDTSERALSSAVLSPVRPGRDVQFPDVVSRLFLHRKCCETLRNLNVEQHSGDTVNKIRGPARVDVKS